MGGSSGLVLFLGRAEVLLVVQRAVLADGDAEQQRKEVGVGVSELAVAARRPDCAGLVALARPALDLAQQLGRLLQLARRGVVVERLRADRLRLAGGVVRAGEQARAARRGVAVPPGRPRDVAP